MDLTEEEYALLRSIARSEGLNKPNSPRKDYQPLMHHPLPPSDHRHLHEENYRKVTSCAAEKQAFAAITKGDAWTLEEVYMNGSPLEVRDKQGNSPVHLAVQMNNTDCLMVLLHAKVDINPVNNLGFTPLYLANAMGLQTIRQMLIENGAKSNIIDVKGEPPHTTILDERVVTKRPQSELDKIMNIPNNAKLY
eukprot:gene13396-17963_t